MPKNFLRASSAAIAASLLALATPAYAGPCDVGVTNPDAIACAGYFAGNLLNDSAADILAQQNAIASLPGPFTFDGNFNVLAKLNSGADLTNGNQINFGTKLFGQTIIGSHFGNIAGPEGNVSVFWLFDFGAAGADFVSLDDPMGFSNAVLYTTTPPAVPEPATWLMMIVGFGAIGYGLRKAKRTRVSVRYA